MSGRYTGCAQICAGRFREAYRETMRGNVLAGVRLCAGETVRPDASTSTNETVPYPALAALDWPQSGEEG